jgi:hypothetical protein
MGLVWSCLVVYSVAVLGASEMDQGCRTLGELRQSISGIGAHDWHIVKREQIRSAWGVALAGVGRDNAGQTVAFTRRSPAGEVVPSCVETLLFDVSSSGRQTNEHLVAVIVRVSLPGHQEAEAALTQLLESVAVPPDASPLAVVTLDDLAPPPVTRVGWTWKGPRSTSRETVRATIAHLGLRWSIDLHWSRDQ